jgi:hypothetical protein
MTPVLHARAISSSTRLVGAITTMKILIAVLAAVLSGAAPAFADLSVAMHDGRVSIVAKDATVRQILAEWARVGQTRIVNVERIPGGPVTLVLENVTEMQALEVLLRPLSGYIAAPRAVAAANLSDYDRIIIMPTLAEGRPAMVASAAPPSVGALPSAPPPPVFQQAEPVPQQAEEAQYNDVPGATVATAGNVGEPAEMRAPPPNTFQKGLEVGRPAEFRSPPRTPVNSAGSPLPPSRGVAAPGMIAPAPLPPGQPAGAPGQPVRRPGGP